MIASPGGRIVGLPGRRVNGRAFSDAVGERPVIVRTRLTRQLVEARLGGVVAIIAPAGYGKTSAVDRWLAAADLRSVRLVLGREHNHPDRVGRALLDTIGAAVALPADLLARASEPEPEWHLTLLPALNAALSDTHLLLVVEDVHHLTDPSASSIVASLVQKTPRRMVLGIVGRRQLGLGLARAHSQGRLAEFVGPALLFGRGDLAPLKRLGLTDSRLGAILECTGGWAAGLPLALSEQGIGDPDEERHALNRYLDEELLPDLSPQLLSFLEDASALVPASAATLDAARQRSDSALLVRLTMQAAVPGASLDADGRVQLGELLGDPLAARLHATDPERERRLLSAAAEHLVTVGEPERAFSLMRRLNDREALVAFVAEVGSRIALEGKTQVAHQWLAAFSDSELIERPRLLGVAALLSFVEGDFALAEQQFSLLTDQGAAMPVHADPSGLSHIGATLLGVDLDQSEQDYRSGLARLLGGALEAVGYLDRGDLPAAESKLRAIAAFTARLPLVDSWRAGILAFVLVRRDKVDEAGEVAEYAISVAERSGLRRHPIMVLAQAVVSLVAARQGRRADAVKAWECAYDGWPRLVEAVPIRGRIPQIALAEAASLLGHEQRALAVLRSLPHDQFPDEIGKFWWAEYGRLLELAGSSVSIK